MDGNVGFKLYMYRYLYCIRHVLEMEMFPHAPLREFGGMPIKNSAKRIQTHEGKCIWACVLVDCFLECVPVSICMRIRVRKRMSACIADPRA